MKMKIPRFLSAGRLCWLLAALVLIPGCLAVAADFSDLDEVLRTFADSRQTRDVKYHGRAADQKAFADTLENRVYRPADRQVIRHVEALPEYQGKRVITHDFRTPGVQGGAVNTDRDVRVLVEVEPSRWIEVPTRKWEDVYYREFAQRTRYTGDLNDPVTLRQHAARYRQMATDRFHVEASHDYSDQTRTLTYEPDGRGGFKRKMAADSDIRVQDGGRGRLKVESTPSVVRAKAGKGLLINPESMSQMYFQKSWAELEIAQGIETRLKNPSLFPAERLRLDNLRQMHTAEGLAQMKKGVETLETLRSSYQNQGYRVGELPKNFRQASEIVKGVTGTSRTDVDAVTRNLQEHGFRSPTEFAENLRGQTESLKFAQKSAPPPAPSTRLQTAGRVAGWAGNLISIEQRLNEARQGSHLFWNFEQGDSDLAIAAKSAMVATAELIPLPIIDAMERGWRVDERAKAYIEDMVRRGESGWETDPAFVMFAVASTITAETISAMTLDPLVAGGQMVVEAFRLGRDVSNNFIADFSHAEQQRLQREMRKAAHDRSEAFDLGGLYGRRGGLEGGPLAGKVEVGETIAFVVQKDARWTSDYFVRWELAIPGGRPAVIVRGLGADAPDAAGVSFTIAEGFSPGLYTVTIRIFERDSGLQVDFREATFTVSDRIGIGAITASKNHFISQGGLPLFAADSEGQSLPTEPGDILAFTVARIGHWTDQHQVVWSVGGENYKIVPGSDPNAHLLRFDSTGMDPRKYRVAVALYSETQKRLAYQDVKLRLGPPLTRPAAFEINARLNDYDGPPLTRSVQNGDILAFKSEISFPEGIQEMSGLVWQLYDANGEPVYGLGKEEYLLAAGETRETRFRFLLEDLPEGSYVLGLFHNYLSHPEMKSRATFAFEVSQSVKIDNLLVTPSQEKQKHHPFLTPDDDALIYAYFSLGRELEQATVKLSAILKQSGETIESVSVERPRSGEKPPYRVGLMVPKELLPVGQEIVARAEILSPDGKRHSAEVSFQKEPYRLGHNLPESLNSGENRQFTVQVPSSFVKPLRVEMRATGEGFSLGHRPGELAGTLGGVATREARVGFLEIKISDADGRTAETRARILINPRPVATPRAASPTPSRQQTPAPRVSTPPAPPRTVVAQGAGAGAPGVSESWAERGRARAEQFIDEFLQIAYSRHPRAAQLVPVVKSELLAQMQASSQKGDGPLYMRFDSWGSTRDEYEFLRIRASMAAALVNVNIEIIMNSNAGLLPQNIRWAEDIGRAVGELERNTSFRLDRFPPALNSVINRQSARISSQSQRAILGALQYNDPRARYTDSISSWDGRVEQGKPVAGSGRFTQRQVLRAAPVSVSAAGYFYDPDLVPVIVEGETYYLSPQDRNRLDTMRRTATLLRLSSSRNHQLDGSHERFDRDILPAMFRVNFNPSEREVVAGYVRR
ncbi:hypothetical protein LZ24_02826 [Desulfobotulus alkaliphilus]|uniref:Uncharacterized protein n=1 Tax=Desulfobotulus alkaliphilus TaxID=622671 RepID=A0A562RCZ8_9BACT|nr:hypothetical protein [Desulfobotulus alkaliphilus]TWI66927.1 hypothetical protein LZ24_02826 [Desulfobotulus alkaliphilus]